jgi:membrane protease YdiL (CAAX protease family)
VDDETLVLRLMLTAGLSVAGVGAAVALLLYAAARGSRGRLFPPVAPVRPAVNGVAVIGAFAIFVMTGAAVQAVLTAAGFYRRLYGADSPAGWPDSAVHTVHYLWSATFAFPVQVILILGLTRVLGGPVPSGRGWARNVVAGYLTWLLVTPAAFVVFVLANIVHARLTGQPPDKHPLTMLGDSAGTREWVLFALQTVLLAPVLEEFVFRGLLLPWLAQRRPPPAPEALLAIPPARRPLMVLILAVGVAVVLQAEDVRQAWAAGDHYAAAAHLIPGGFFLALVPLSFVPFDRLRRHLRVRCRQHARAILASAALFAAFHAHVWPSPVPLVVLAVGLGYLYVRTRSLVAPVVVHGMFNAVSTVYLLLGGPA